MPGTAEGALPDVNPSDVTGHPSTTLETLRFENHSIRELPVDPSSDPEPRRCSGAYTRVPLSPLSQPRLVAYSPGALRELGISESDTRRREFVEYFAGNKLLPGACPHAHCYCGFQYGYFSGQLGDGASM